VLTSLKATAPHANRLLGLLAPRDYRRIFDPFRWRTGSLYRAHKPIEFVYFIETGVGSLVNTMASGQAAEVGTIGNEGVVGLPIMLGDDRAPTSVYIQVPGVGLRMKATLFKKELERSASMRAVMLRYVHAFFNQVGQSEILAMMLGVQRTGVSAAAGALQRAGLIRYKRGNVTVVDRRGLMKRSCECYGVSKKEFDRLLGDRAIRKVRSRRT
jgi:CRP-like cAMP-binding protein